MDGFNAVFETAETDMTKIAAARALFRLIVDTLQDGETATADIPYFKIGAIHCKVFSKCRCETSGHKVRYCQLKITGSNPSLPLWINFIELDVIDANVNHIGRYEPWRNLIVIFTKPFACPPDKMNDKDSYRRELADYLLDFNNDDYIATTVVHELIHFIDHKLTGTLKETALLSSDDADNNMRYYNNGIETNARYSATMDMFLQQIKMNFDLFSMLLSNKGFIGIVNWLTNLIYDASIAKDKPKPQTLLIHKIRNRIKRRVANALIKIKHDSYGEWERYVFMSLSDIQKKEGISLTTDDLDFVLHKWLGDVPNHIIDNLVHDYSATQIQPRKC